MLGRQYKSEAKPLFNWKCQKCLCLETWSNHFTDWYHSYASPSQWTILEKRERLSFLLPKLLEYITKGEYTDSVTLELRLRISVMYLWILKQYCIIINYHYFLDTLCVMYPFFNQIMHIFYIINYMYINYIWRDW